MKNLFATIILVLLVSVTFAQTKSHQLSTHILDVSKGLPASEVTIKLEKLNEKENAWNLVDEKITDSNGRIDDFLKQDKSNLGIYRLTFFVKDYFEKNKLFTFYPFIEVVFEIIDGEHYHVPITLSPFGYSTYRGN